MKKEYLHNITANQCLLLTLSTKFVQYNIVYKFTRMRNIIYKSNIALKQVKALIDNFTNYTDTNHFTCLINFVLYYHMSHECI